MSLPSLKDVLRSIGLPGSPQKAPGSCGASSRRDRGNGNGPANSASSSSSSGTAKDSPCHREVEHVSVSEDMSRTEKNETSSAGGRRRRHELDMTAGDWDSPSTQSGLSEGSGSVSTTTGADPSGVCGSNSSWDGSDPQWDSGDNEHHRALAVSPSPGHSTPIYATTKRARLADSSSITGVGDGRGGEDGGERGRSGGNGTRGRSSRSGSVLEQGYRHPPPSHSTAEWRAVEKAARILGVDSLEERDVEDQRRFSMVKAARMFGVDNVEEIQVAQERASGNRPKWAPPRSSASKAARMLGVEDVSELQVNRPRHVGRQRPSSAQVVRSRYQPPQGSISSLIRALEISGTETQQSSAEQQSSIREEETGSAHSVNSTRGTESCSSVSDLHMQDGDGGVECTTAAAQTQAGPTGLQSSKKSELLDDQMAGLQTPQHTTAIESSTNEGRSTRDDMEIETPPSQPRSAALASLKQVPLPLPAPYTPSVPGTCRPSPSPLGSLGPGPSPAGSPLGSMLTPRNVSITSPSMVAARQHCPSFTVGGSGGERSPVFQRIAVSGSEASGKGAGGDILPIVGRVAEAKGRSPPGNEAFGDEPDGTKWRIATPAPSPIITSGATPSATAASAALGDTQHGGCSTRLASPPTTPAPSPIEPRSLGSSSSAPPTFHIASAKEPRGRFPSMEYKQVSPVGNPGELGSPPANFAALSEYGGWHSPEAKPDVQSPVPEVPNGWPVPTRPSSAPIPGSQHHLQRGGRFSPTVNGFSHERNRHAISPMGRSRGFTRSERNTIGDKPGDGEESSSEACPDRMDDGEEASSGGGIGGGCVNDYKGLAAMIPVINPSHIGTHRSASAAGNAIVKTEDNCISGSGKSKPRRRPAPPKSQPWGDDNVDQIALSPLLSKAPYDNGISGGEPGMDTSPAPGVSTRKQQEVATRPREKGRFVKRPPAFLPISAFKTYGDRNEADAAAERAEEAREEAEEAAQRAAAAAKVVTTGYRSGASMFSPGSSTSTPATLPSLGDEAGGGGGASGGRREIAPWAGSGFRSENVERAEKYKENSGNRMQEEARNSRNFTSGYGRDGADRRVDRRDPMAVDMINKQPSPISNSVRVGRPGVMGPPGGMRRGFQQSGPGRRRSDRMTSTQSRGPHTVIWTQPDAEAGVSDMGMGGDEHMTTITSTGGEPSDCGSDDLRGMDFLPCSPMDGNSPRSSTWDSPHRGTYSTAGSAASTPVHSIRRGYEGRGFGSSASPRAVPQLTDLPPASPGGGTPWQGARGEPGSDIVSGSRGAEQGR